MRAGRGAVVADALAVRHSALRSSFGLVWPRPPRRARASPSGSWPRALPDREVGLTAAAVSAVMICTQLAVLGAGSAVIVSVGRGEPPARLLDSAFATVGIAGSVLALGYLVVQSTAAPGHGIDISSLLGHVSFWHGHRNGGHRAGPGARSAGSRCQRNLTVHAGWCGFTRSCGARGLARPRCPADVLLACWTLATAVACVVGAVQLRQRWDTVRGRPCAPCASASWP